MFTGHIREQGVIDGFDGAHVQVRVPRSAAAISPGGSVCVSGARLTVTGAGDGAFGATIAAETRRALDLRRPGRRRPGQCRAAADRRRRPGRPPGPGVRRRRRQGRAPATRAATTLDRPQPGARVNLELDLVNRLVRRGAATARADLPRVTAGLAGAGHVSGQAGVDQVLARLVAGCGLAVWDPDAENEGDVIFRASSCGRTRSGSC